MSYVKFAVKPKHPLRKAVDDVLYPHKDFLDIVKCGAGAQALSWLKTSHAAIMDDAGKFYPVDEDNILEQFDLVAAGEAPTVEEDADFGIPKLDTYVTDPITGGETAESDVLGKTLGELQSGVEVYNGITSGVLYKVTNYTGFNSTDVTEQNGYYLVFFNNVTDAEAVGYSDIKFFVVGGTGNEVTPDEGMNMIFLGATPEIASKKKLGMKATLTTKTTDEDGTEVTNTEEVTVVFDNRLRCVDLEEGLIPVNPLNDSVVDPVVDTEKKVVFLNGNEGSIKPAEDGSGAQIIVNGKAIYTGSLEGFNIYGGGKAGTHFAKSRITVNNVNGGNWSISAGGLGSFDDSEDPTLSADVDEAVLVVNGDDTVINAIGGGSDGRGTVKDAYVTINGGTITGLNGGGFASTSAGSLGGDAAIHPENSGNKVETVHLTINGGSIPTVFGGGQGYACVEKAIIKINNFVSSSGIVISAGSNGYTGETDLTIDGADTNIGTVVSYNRGWAKKTSITINNGTINEVYAGVNGSDDGSSSMEKHGIQESITITVNGGTVTSIVAGDNPEAIQPDDPKVHVYVAEKATVTNIDAAKTAFGTSITVAGDDDPEVVEEETPAEDDQEESTEIEQDSPEAGDLESDPVL